MLNNRLSLYTQTRRIITGVFLTLLLIILSKAAGAQVYPVTGNAVLIPPYSVYLSDYTSRSTERLVLNIVLKDITRPELRVRLRMKIEGQNAKLETKQEYVGSEIVLQGGIPLRISGIDLAEYFIPNNLNFSGISRKEFEKTGALPEGFYTFSFEVLEYNRGVKISNTISAPGWLILNDPPMVNLPRNNEKLVPTMPQNLVLQWTPRHTGSPNSAFSTEYEITMVEVWPANRNPNDAIFTSPPILETTTRSTTFIYGIAETPLELGRRYAFRVKAKSIVGAEEYDLFKNNGYSEVVTFVYGDACDLPIHVTAEGINPSRFKVQWMGQFNHTGYTVRYRAAGDPNAQWFTTNTLLNEVEISSLKANTSYEYQLVGKCGVFESNFTTVANVKTKSAPVGDYSCGIPPEDLALDDSLLMASLKPGDVVQTGDFEVELTKVTGSNGAFTGEGIVIVPFLNNVKVKTVFNDITVNDQGRMVKGYMNVTGAAVDLVPDEVMVLMDDLTQALDEIDKGLDLAEDVLDEIDAALVLAEKIIKEIQAYLPDAIVQEINQARTEISAARAEMQAAQTPEAKAAAKEKLKTAKNKLRDAAGKALDHYTKTIADLLKLLKEIFIKLNTDTKAFIAQLKGQKNTADSEFGAASAPLIAIRNEASVGQSETGEVGKVYSIAGGTQEEAISENELIEMRKDPRIKAFLEKLAELGRIVALLEANTKILELIGKAINDPNALKNYANILREKAEREDQTLKNAIKEGKLNTPEIRDRIIAIVKESLFQDYLNSTP